MILTRVARESKMTTFLVQSWFLIPSLFLLHCSDATTLKKVLLSDAAVTKGAVCLDGSPPGYYIHNGTATPNKWIIHFEGGAWCENKQECSLRSYTPLGSSNYWPDTQDYSGLLSDDCTINPYFCGWSMVLVGYCDGASFAGNVDDPVVWKGITMYFRGFRILNAVIDEILVIAGNNIEEVILTGCSAGGLATYLHADTVRSKIPSNIPVNAISDAGYFIDAPNTEGEMRIRGVYQNVFEMHNCTGGVNQNCITANPDEKWKCFMAQYTYPHIKTPIFSLNSRYDTWQLYFVLQIQCLVPYCTQRQMEQVKNFGEEFLVAASPANLSHSNGVYFDSCIIHCQSVQADSWSQIKVGNQTIWETFYSWLTKNNTSYSSKQIDQCAYPCNPTCVHHIFKNIV